MKKCSLTEEEIENINLKNPAIFQVFNEMISLEGLLKSIKIKPERYAEKNGRVFQTITEELPAFLGNNILMEIKCILARKDYWSLEERLGNPLTLRVITTAPFWEILQNMHFADNLQNLPTTDSEQYDGAWKLQPLFDHLLEYFQKAMQLEFRHLIDRHMCKFKGKNLMYQSMKNNPAKRGFKFWFCCG